jgi:hypothetical protein
MHPRQPTVTVSTASLDLIASSQEFGTTTDGYLKNVPEAVIPFYSRDQPKTISRDKNHEIN